MQNRAIVIMAGGSGERFWPLSRKHRPKQFLPLTSNQPMLADTVDRAKTLVPLERVYVVAGPHLEQSIRRILPQLPSENLIVEPTGKNTAPCIALSAAVICARHGANTAMGILSADSLVRNLEGFSRNANLALEYAENQNVLVLMGIRPRHPDTGFGYLEIGPAIRHSETGTVHGVESFREKPDADTARHYLETGRFLWNSGMFFWKISTFLQALEDVAVGFAAGARRIAEAYGTPGFGNVVESVFSDWPSISIDYALLEKSGNVCAVAGAFDWDDVGTWSALSRTNALDENSNAIQGEVLAIDSKNSILCNYMPSAGPGSAKPIVAALGMESVVVVATEDAILVCQADRAQDIKLILNALKIRDPQEHI